MKLCDVQKVRYQLEVQYLGTDFSGWQSQADGSGIQDCIERALRTILARPCRVVGASRTDAGVHAKHQVAIFDSLTPLDCERLLTSLSALLPSSIGISSLRICPSHFHPIAQARAKAYCYRFWQGRSRDPFIEPYIYRVPKGLALANMLEGAKHFIGTHDFSAFCASDSGAKTRVRTILATEIREVGPVVEFWILGEGFLKQMVRIMAGTILQIGLGKRATNTIAELLQNGSRETSGPTLPGRGLTLERIFFEPPPVCDGPTGWII